MFSDFKFPDLRRLFFALTMACTLASPAVSDTDEATLELQVWNFVLSDNSVEAYEMFMRTYPDSIRSNEAQVRIQALKSGGEVETATAPTVSTSTASSKIDEQSIFQLLGPVTLDKPFEFGHKAILGKTIVEIIDMSPIYSPVEGLPAEAWENKSCSGCHEWTPETLCKQAGNYIDAEPARYQEKKHPFGGSFKINLRQWAINDCQ